MTGPWLTIVGINPDGMLSPPAVAALRRAETVWGGRRHLAAAAAHVGGQARPWPSPMADAYAAILAERGRPVAVLASGDPFRFGVGSTLAGMVPAGEWVCHPAPSAFTLARARLGWGDAVETSVCGRPVASLVPLLHGGARLLVLSADSASPATVAALLAAQGFGASTLHVLEDMTGPAERHRTATAAGFDLVDVAALNMLGIECRGSPRTHAATGLPDSVFDHDGQLTRREIRAVTLSSLAPQPGELLWDLGAGAGSVGIEWMLRHPANRAVAIERDPDRASRIAANAASLGTPGLTVVTGAAPDALAGLPPPDAVFVGGGGPAVLDAAWAAMPVGARLVANSVTLETDAALLSARARWGGTLLRVALERLDKVGPLHAFRPAMTVTQWAAIK